ncbi:Hypothetical protein FKW44_000670 [Caligus rogercresseyi]|uniref:Uncharacterized protein n=1 Tax=Caligus rogercresseyi TaxID=217165 RepID=A0A7T8KHM8_CALRO|nr:Hypothetical protein FKW44_000670 [Caligus rogercresseyi]
MGPRVPPNTIGVFGVKNPPPTGPGFHQTYSGCFGVTNPLPMCPRVLPNTIGVFWGYKSPANGPLGSV